MPPSTGLFEDGLGRGSLSTWNALERSLLGGLLFRSGTWNAEQFHGKVMTASSIDIIDSVALCVSCWIEIATPFMRREETAKIGQVIRLD